MLTFELNFVFKQKTSDKKLKSKEEEQNKKLTIELNKQKQLLSDQHIKEIKLLNKSMFSYSEAILNIFF